MKKKQLIINLVSNFIAFGISLLISFGLTPYLISTIGKEAYSFYPLSNNFITYMTLVTIALNSMATRFITVEISRENSDKAKIYYSSVFFSNVILALLLVIPMTIIVIYLDSFLKIPHNLIIEVKLLFTLVFLSLLINLITTVFGVATIAKNRLDLSSYGQILQNVIKITLYLLLFTLFNSNIVLIGIVALILSITNQIIQIYFAKKILPDFKVSFKYFKWEAVIELLKSGIWNSINSLGAVMLISMSILLANIFLGPVAAGELSIAQTLILFISSVISMLFSIFMPRITQIYAKNNLVDLVKEVKFSQKLIGLFSTSPILLVLIFGKEFYTLWVPSEDGEKLYLLTILSIVPLLVHGNMWSVYGLNIVLNKIKLPSILLIVLGLLNIIISIFSLYFLESVYIIPLVSGFISISFYYFFIPVYAAKQLSIKPNTFLKHINKVIMFSSVFIFLSVKIKKLISIENWFDFFFYGFIFGIAGLIFNILISLNKNELISIYKLLIPLLERLIWVKKI